MAKFVAGTLVIKKDQTGDDYYGSRIEHIPFHSPSILIDEVIEKDWRKTSFYLINNKRWPVAYVEKYYKMQLGSLLKRL